MIQGLLLSLLLLVPQDSSRIVLTSGARDFAVSPEGRVAFELNGDIWMTIRPATPDELTLDAGNLMQVTSGPTWDREPAWRTAGTAIVFSSDRAGTYDLWQIPVLPDGTVGDPEAITSSPLADGEPATATDGSIVFVRGTGRDADLWIVDSGGDVRLLKGSDIGEFSPTVSPDGENVAYVGETPGGRELRVGPIIGDADRAIVSDRPVEDPAWSPSGALIAFTTRGSSTGVWVTPTDGRYVNLVSERSARATWFPEGKWQLLAELQRPGPGYNGDPDRVGDRTAGDLLENRNRMWVIQTGIVPDAHANELKLEAVLDRRSYNAAAFDRVRERVEELYYGRQRSSEWGRLVGEYRERAVVAQSQEQLQAVLDELTRVRPSSRSEVGGPAAVSTAHPLATAAGISILERGGNVVDAAVAVSFAIGVVEPDASGIGGYGEMVLYLKNMDEPVVIEFLSRVPEAGGLTNASLLQDGRLPSDGPMLANVPGTVAGMWRAWSEYGSGRVEWADLLGPAIEYAEQGFPVSDGFATTLALEAARFLKYESSESLFFEDGRPHGEGYELRNPDLAWTLKQIASGGADAFYRGAVAERIVQDLRGRGNAITRLDMERYYAAKRQPVSGEYRGHTIYSAAPAASGGVSLVSKLNLLDNFESPSLFSDDAATAHAMIEAWKLTLSTSGRIADPGLWPIDLARVLDREAAERRWTSCFDKEKSLTPEDLQTTVGGEPDCATNTQYGLSWGEEIHDCPPGDECKATGTTAFAVADAEGNVVAVTQTLGTWGGNFYVTPGLGFLYNDKLRSYSSDPRAFGARLPNARHGTSIAPTLVFKGLGDDQTPLMAVGAAGNAWITSAVYQVVTAMIDGGIGPQAALELPRFLVGSRRSGDGTVWIQVEDAFGPGVLAQLERLGHRIQRISLKGELRMGYGAAVLIDGNRVRAGGDPRRSGYADATR